MLKETHLWRTRDCRALRLGIRVYWDKGVIHQDADMLANFLSSMQCRDYLRRNEVESYMPRLLFLMKLNLRQELDVKNWTVQLPNLCFTYAILPSYSTQKDAAKNHSHHGVWCQPVQVEAFLC